MKPFREIEIDFDRVVGGAIAAAEANVVNEFWTIDGCVYHVKWGVFMNVEGQAFEPGTDLEVRLGSEYGSQVYNHRGDWTPSGMNEILRQGIDRGLKRIQAWRKGEGEFPATIEELFAPEKTSP
jgi:hypothetical protein